MVERKILIIDDQPEMIREAKYALEELGYDVRLAGDGRDGMDKLQQFKPDLLLLDLVLPDLSGFKIAQEIKSLKQFQDLPIIAISLKREQVDKHVAAKVGIAEYIEKPIDINRLLFCIKNIFKE
jgi:DNA-binding response OmpR family regulator